MSEFHYRPQTSEEEFEYSQSLYSEEEFYKKYGYEVTYPTAEEFLKAKQEGVENLEEIFEKYEYDKNFYNKGIEAINLKIDDIKKAIERFGEFNKKFNFKIFNQYNVVLTKYGPGGAYNAKTGSVLLKQLPGGKFIEDESPSDTIIHEMIHMGIEKDIVKKYNLTHSQKEAVVDAICIKYFSDILPDYKKQSISEDEMFDLVMRVDLEDLEERIINK